MIRGGAGRYIGKKLSKAYKSAFLKLSVDYRYRKNIFPIIERKNRYRKIRHKYTGKQTTNKREDKHD